MTSLKDKVAIITGSSRGIGAEIARNLAAKGAKVVINYVSDETSAKKVETEIVAQGGTAFLCQGDIGKIAEIEKIYQKTIEQFGRVDVVVNNAGVINYDPLDKVTEETFDKLFTINVKGTYFMCQKALTYMQEGGSIINFSTSVTGAMMPNYSLYAGTKGAVEQFTRQLSKEFGKKNIRINAIAPGPINTELFRKGKTEEQMKFFASMNAFNRLGETDDIAKVVAFLASPDSEWVSGQVLRVNGAFV